MSAVLNLPEGVNPSAAYQLSVERREYWPLPDRDYVGVGWECSEWMWWYPAVGPLDVQPGSVVTIVPERDIP